LFDQSVFSILGTADENFNERLIDGKDEGQALRKVDFLIRHEVTTYKRDENYQLQDGFFFLPDHFM